MPEEKKEEEFTFVDKRRMVREEPEQKKEEEKPKQKPQATAQNIPQPPQEMHAIPEEDMQGMEGMPGDEGQEADVASLLKWFSEMLFGNALLWMGLVAHPQTGRTVRDMKQARLAIDTLEILFQKLSEEFLSELERKNFQAMISKLKMDFVNQSKLL